MDLVVVSSPFPVRRYGAFSSRLWRSKTSERLEVKGGLGGLGDQSRKGLIRGGTWRIFRAAEVIARSYVYPITFLRLSQADVG